MGVREMTISAYPALRAPASRKGATSIDDALQIGDGEKMAFQA